VRIVPIKHWWPKQQPANDLGPEEWHRDWKQFFRSGIYQDFVHEMAVHVFDEGVSYLFQVEPNLRIHPPGGVCVPWHTDAEFGHLPEEWNVWVPLTETTNDSQRLWIDGYCKNCPCPMVVPFGSALIFHGAEVRHGNVVNTTDITRVSFDFRLLAKEHYRDTGARTVKYDIPLRVPEYWVEMT
jgi:ectoine hydroxylase-related dioxygenase (phytanoyl-CoA dioxygenase family)